MAKAKGTKEAPVEDVSVDLDVEQSDTYATEADKPTTGTKVGDWLSYGNGNPDWNDPDD